MTITVTPIPQLVDLAVPAFTLGTANAAGSAATAVASDSTLLAFDTTDPADVAAAAAVGAATVSARRDHVHAGTTATGTVVDESITRFNGTGGASLQGYSSLSPTISDAGIISLTSGALKFPATAIASSDANTLDDFEFGTWTPGIADATKNPTSEGQTYSIRLGWYQKVAAWVSIVGWVTLSDKGTMTAGDACYITGLPFASSSTSYAQSSTLVIGDCAGFNFATAGFSPTGGVPDGGTTHINLKLWDGTSGVSTLTISEITDSVAILFSVNYLT